MRFVGNVKVNTVPFLRMLLTEILPPCASTIRLQIGRPKPVPFALVVLRGVQSSCIDSSGIPIPVSEKLIKTCPFCL